MHLILIGMAALVAAGLAALACGRNERLAARIGAAGPLAAAGCLAAVAIGVLRTGRPVDFTFPWSMRWGAGTVTLDPLGAFFLLPIIILSALAAVYAIGYPVHGRAGRMWLSFNLLVFGMAGVCLAANGLLFLVVWEIMALASFFLVAHENERGEVRHAAWIYLVATHAGTVCLVAMFLIMGRLAGSLDFAAFTSASFKGAAALLLILGLVGFGTKAGLMPLHVWLPEAHPAAPSPVSALMSGVMIKTGIYGLLRLLIFLCPPAPWWGWVLVAVGAVSAVLGVLLALAQRDLKRLLAYCSVENVGIICMGIGLGVTGLATGQPFMAVLGFAGALLHVVNHAVFKGLLFMAAGAVAGAAHTRDMERLGGLLKRMPVTGAAFLVGALAISGLPPFNGFVSKFLILWAAFSGTMAAGPETALPALVVVTALALAGGLAAVTFTKVFGTVFLGNPRSSAVDKAGDAGGFMTVPMVILAAACLAGGLAGREMLRGMQPVLAMFIGTGGAASLVTPARVLGPVALGGAVLLGLAAVLFLVRRWLLSGREVGSAVTWDCGYTAPSPRMQYTGSSFGRPVTRLFRAFLGFRSRILSPRGLFPVRADLETQVPDMYTERMYRPAYQGLRRLLDRLRVVQHGRIQVYILYVVMTLLVLLVWKLR
ncbi:MAG: proton-conducting transporter membrane subunit [Planctomycetota bacterium]